VEISPADLGVGFVSGWVVGCGEFSGAKKILVYDDQGDVIEVWDSHNPDPIVKQLGYMYVWGLFRTSTGKQASMRIFNGWPFAFRAHTDNDFQSRFNSPLLALNIAIALVILLATFFTTESYLRRQAKWQFSIQGIMVFTAFVALLLTNGKYDLVRWRGKESWEYIPFFFIAVGLWCVFWTGWRLAAWKLGRMAEVVKDG